MNEPSASDPNWHCPVPTDGSTDRVLLAHGEGGLLMRRLIAERILARLGEAAAVTLDDAAIADTVFSTLMGDDVEPRRDFIERNARSVEFLDV
jgi:hypothetical protein